MAGDQVSESDGMLADRTVFVVPALELTREGSEDAVPSHVQDKAELQRLWERHVVTTMHPCCNGYAGTVAIMMTVECTHA